jgi:translation initiation factor 5A
MIFRRLHWETATVIVAFTTNRHLILLCLHSFSSFMMIKGKPCKILSISVSKTGKHGHAKCNFLATDIFTGKKLEDMIPSTHGTTVPIVIKTEWEIIDIEGEELTLMDEGGNQKTDLNLPTYPDSLGKDIVEAWAGGDNQISVSVQAAVGIEQIISFKVVTN